jgi:CoA-transferase family III
MVTDSLQNELLARLWRSVAGDLEAPPVEIDGPVTLDSAFAVSEFAAASIAVAGMAASVALFDSDDEGDARPVKVDRPLASAWYGTAVQLPEPISPWDSIAGDYPTADGFIRLHTNAPHHKAAALRVLGCADDRESVATAVLTWTGLDLETAIAEANGCAAEMQTWTSWSRHPQGEAVAGEPLVAWADGSAGAHGGLRVLDLTRVIAGPVATRFLAGFGADVLRIDPPDWQEPVLEPDMTLGKRTARLDLKTDVGLATLRELASEADIVVHGYRADALEKLGLDFDTIRPGIVDVAIDAYGWSGPWRNRRGFDSLVQMSAGIAEEGMRWYAREKPTPLPVQALDHSTGYLAAAATLIGLARRADTGRGSSARLSLARTALELTGVGRGEEPEQAPLQIGAHLQTPWGSAQLLPPPLTVGGQSPTWSRGPRPLGSDQPRWSSLSRPAGE